MAYKKYENKCEKILLSKFNDQYKNWGHELVEFPEGSIFLRVWGDGYIQEYIEFEDLMDILKTLKLRYKVMGKEDLINQIKHVVQTLEEAEKLVAKESMVQCMIEGAVQELEAMISEEV